MTVVRGHFRNTKKGRTWVKAHARQGPVGKQWRQGWESEISKAGRRYNLGEVYDNIEGVNEQLQHEISTMEGKLGPIDRTIENMERTGTGVGSKGYNEFKKQRKNLQANIRRLESRSMYLTKRQETIGKELKSARKKGIRTYR